MPKFTVAICLASGLKRKIPNCTWLSAQTTDENLKWYLIETYMPCTVKGKPLEKVCLGLALRDSCGGHCGIMMVHSQYTAPQRTICDFKLQNHTDRCKLSRKRVKGTYSARYIIFVVWSKALEKTHDSLLQGYLIDFKGPYIVADTIWLALVVPLKKSSKPIIADW